MENLHISYKNSANQELSITISGDFVIGGDQFDSKHLLATLKKSHILKCVIDATMLGKWDSICVVFMADVVKICKQNNIVCDLSLLPDGIQKLIAIALERSGVTKPRVEDTLLPYFEKLGDSALITLKTIRIVIAFLSDILLMFSRFASSKTKFRSVDFLNILQDCGVDALPIVSLISFMIGLIFAFVGAVQLEMFSAEIYVASLVAIAMLRVMSAIMTGIIMAGRTGSSYAAAISSMQANEETDALKTMGLSPLEFLIMPRILAMMLMMPLLTIYANFMGILGGMAVGVFMLDIPIQQYWGMTLSALSFKNFAVGLIHSIVFSIIIALCGCFFGMHGGRDANSVGIATTKAVVSSIVWMTIATGIITFICKVIGI